MEKELMEKIGIMDDFYKKLNKSFEKVELTMEGDVLVLKIIPKFKLSEKRYYNEAEVAENPAYSKGYFKEESVKEFIRLLKEDEPIGFSIGKEYDSRSVKLGIQKERQRLFDKIKELVGDLK